MAPSIGNIVVAIVPLVVPSLILVHLIGNPQPIVSVWLKYTPTGDEGKYDAPPTGTPTVQAQLLAYVCMALLGYIGTRRLIPQIQQFTLKKGISGKDMGKRGTSLAEKDIPEALGIVPGAVFLVCLIFCLVGYATSHPSKLLDVNSALLSICFMLFLGFTDDVLDWPWRYKLFLPSVASLPLLCCYNGSTSVVVPLQLRPLIWANGDATWMGHFLSHLIVIDSKADGSLVELGFFYFLYMGMLAVFCTNAINIFAGINGLEAGQSYVIGCAVLVHNLVEISAGRLVENHLFSAMVMLSFVGVTLGLLGHNWYPATVFVGDTFCYFAGMTFAVVGILGHFSKTLLLFFMPQVLNFLWSTPQLFKFMPCPRHRLPRFNPQTGKMEPSTFTCKPHQFRWLKSHPNDTEVPNMTVINLCLQILGPLGERELCVALLALQIASCSLGFLCRYYLAQFFFDD